MFDGNDREDTFYLRAQEAFILDRLIRHCDDIILKLEGKKDDYDPDRNSTLSYFNLLANPTRIRRHYSVDDLLIMDLKKLGRLVFSL